MKNERVTVNDLLTIFKKRAVALLLSFLILALGGFGVRMLLPPSYRTTANFYVRNLQSEQLLLDYGLTSSQLAVVQSLAKEYARVAMESDEFKTLVTEKHALPVTAAELGTMLSATSDSATVTLTVTGGNAATVDAVMAAVAAEFPAFIGAYVWPNLEIDFQVVTPLQAPTPAVRATWHPCLWGLACGGAGLLLCYLYFLFAFLFSDRMVDADEVSRVLPSGLMIGAVPRILPPLDEAEAFFAVRERLPRSDGNSACTLAVTSADPLEGKSYVTVGLARSLAVSGKRVLVIDADLRREARYPFYFPKAEKGLGNYLAGEVSDPAALVVKSPVKGVFVLPAGHTTVSPCDMPFAQRLVALLQSLSAEYDYVFVDFPALSQGPEAVAAAADHTAALLISAVGRGRASHLRAACKTLVAANGNLCGVIANHPPKSK